MPKTYKHLDANERDILAVLKSNGRSLREISTILKRSPSTLSRELQRNAPPVYTGYYLSHKAQERADKRNRESHRRPRLKTDSLRQYVEKRIRLGWSPELIAERLALEHPELSISHEAIYQWIVKFGGRNVDFGINIMNHESKIFYSGFPNPCLRSGR